MAINKHQAADASIQAKLKLQRSPKWPEVERAFRTKNPNCLACTENQQLNVHHMYPFHYVVLCGRPDLELDPRNLITLCTREDEEHHLLLGHLDDFESYNPQVETFIQTYKDRPASQIKGDAAWQTARGGKPKHVELMSPEDKEQFKAMLDGKFPADPAIVKEAEEARQSLSKTSAPPEVPGSSAVAGPLAAKSSA